MNLNFTHYRNFWVPTRYNRCLILVHMLEAVFSRFVERVYTSDIALSACGWMETKKVPWLQLESYQLRITKLYCSDIEGAIDFITLGIFGFHKVFNSSCLAVFLLTRALLPHMAAKWLYFPHLEHVHLYAWQISLFKLSVFSLFLHFFVVALFLSCVDWPVTKRVRGEQAAVYWHLGASYCHDRKDQY